MTFPSEWKDDGYLQKISRTMKTFSATHSDYPPVWLLTIQVQTSISTPTRSGIREFKPRGNELLKGIGLQRNLLAFLSAITRNC